MSPEQALGKEVDYRSDQFSFGLILHEMASGKQAFARNSSVETMAAIVRDEPPAIEEKIPAPLKWIIDRCLHKEPEQRYESTRDLFHELKNLREHFSEAYSSSGALAAVPVKARPLAGNFSPESPRVPGSSAAWRPSQAGRSGLANYRYTPFAVRRLAGRVVAGWKGRRLFGQGQWNLPGLPALSQLARPGAADP